jgi:3-hydroxyisobutyrate dehydrogenase
VQVVEVVVLDDAQVREVVLGPDGLLAGAAGGLIVLIHSTVDPQTVVEVAAAAAPRGVVVLDAAVSGAHGQASAEAGQLCVMVGGARESFEAVRPLLASFASTIEHLGPLGSGMAAKLARNLITYLSYLAAYEGLHLAEQLGIERKTLARILEATGVRSETVAAFLQVRASLRPLDPAAEPDAYAAATAAALTGRKDLGAALALARRHGLDLPSARHAIERMDALFGVTGGAEMSDNARTLQRFFQTLLAGDLGALGALLADEVVWHVPPSAAQRFAEPRGRDAVLKFLGSATGEFFEPGSMRFQSELQAVEGEQAIAIGWMTGRTAAGAPYANRYAWGLRLRGGRICDVYELLDTAHLQAQLGTPG